MQEIQEKKSESKIEVAVISEKGKRPENQDWMSWYTVPWGDCYIVADGMGGHRGGALAARMTVEGLERHLGRASADMPFESALRTAFQKTNEEVFQAAHSGDPATENMGSTLIAVLIANAKVQVGHVGDSRGYLFRKGKLRRLTRDHTNVQRMLDAGMLTEQQARDHPDASVLSRAVGSKPDSEIEISEPMELEESDCVLLCSDGLCGYVEDGDIEKTLRQQTNVQKVPKALVDLALKCGSEDNVTVQYVRYGKRLAVKAPEQSAEGGEAQSGHDWLTRAKRRKGLWIAGACGLILCLAMLVWLVPWPWTRVAQGGPEQAQQKGKAPSSSGTSSASATPPATAAPEASTVSSTTLKPENAKDRNAKGGNAKGTPAGAGGPKDAKKTSTSANDNGKKTTDKKTTDKKGAQNGKETKGHPKAGELEASGAGAASATPGSSARTAQLEVGVSLQDPGRDVIDGGIQDVLSSDKFTPRAVRWDSLPDSAQSMQRAFVGYSEDSEKASAEALAKLLAQKAELGLGSLQVTKYSPELKKAVNSVPLLLVVPRKGDPDDQ